MRVPRLRWWIAAAIVITVLANASDRNARRDTPAPASPVGSEVRLIASARNKALFMPDERIRDQIDRVVSQGDQEGYVLLLLSDRIWRISRGTRARELETSGHWTRVRLLEGEHSLRDGWVDSSDVHHP